MNARILFVIAAFLASGCELLGLEDPAKLAAAKEAEGKAIGSACRHSGRALEECYDNSPKVSKAAIFAGWREMDGYMRENQIPTMGREPAAEGEQAKAGEDKPKAEAEAPAAKEEKKAAPAKPSAAKQTDAAPAARTPASGRRVRVTQVDGLYPGQDFV